jgi:hypothetical protein
MIDVNTRGILRGSGCASPKASWLFDKKELVSMIAIGSKTAV